MADITKTGVTVNFSIPLVNAQGDQTVRSLTVDVNDDSISSALKGRATLFASQLETDYPGLLQPLGWRDSDIAEEAWSLSGGSGAVDVKISYKEEVTLDRG